MARCRAETRNEESRETTFVRRNGCVMQNERAGQKPLRSLAKAGGTYALVAALIVGVTGTCFAGERYRHHGGHGYHHGEQGSYHGGYWSPRKGHQYRHGGYRSRHGKEHRDYAVTAVLGLGMLALALSRAHVDVYRYETRAPARVHYRPQTVHAAPQVRYVERPVRYVERPVQPAPLRVVQQRSALPLGCLMIREYQTQITVGGKEFDAYGDACLHADGSWSRGTPKLVPQ